MVERVARYDLTLFLPADTHAKRVDGVILQDDGPRGLLRYPFFDHDEMFRMVGGDTNTRFLVSNAFWSDQAGDQMQAYADVMHDAGVRIFTRPATWPNYNDEFRQIFICMPGVDIDIVLAQPHNFYHRNAGAPPPGTLFQ